MYRCVRGNGLCIFHRSGREEIRTRMRLISQRKYACVRTQECDVVAINISNKKVIYILAVYLYIIGLYHVLRKFNKTTRTNQ